MALTSTQIGSLVSAISSHWNLNGLRMAADDLGIALDDLAPGAPLTKAAFDLITHLNSAAPPRDGMLLRKLEMTAPPAVRALATELLNPPFFPPDDPHDAELIGKIVFIDRIELRDQLREFTFSTANSPHVLIVRGEEPCGKTYTQLFLRHLAQAFGATAPVVDVDADEYTPRTLIEDIFDRVNLDLGRLPPMPDDPQLARIEPLVAKFAGAIQVMPPPHRYWLIIDGLNGPNATKPVLDLVFALAREVQRILPDHLWLVLLGYNPPIEDPLLFDIAQEDARFPEPEYVARHLAALAGAGGHVLPAVKADEVARAFYEGFPTLDKPAMVRFTRDLRILGQQARAGAFQ